MVILFEALLTSNQEYLENFKKLFILYLTMRVLPYNRIQILNAVSNTMKPLTPNIPII